MVAAVLVYRRKDAFYARAKAAGYRSRAAFKLAQLARTHRLFRRGDTVVDLGAWPGGWLQVVAQQVGPQGRVIGVDVRPIERLAERTVVTVHGDITDPETRAHVAAVCGGKADVLLSDLAPTLSGVRARDEEQAEALAECVLEWVQCILKPGGTLVVKLFMSPALSRYVARLRLLFRKVHTTRPEATRKGSAEVYALASGFRRDVTAA